MEEPERWVTGAMPSRRPGARRWQSPRRRLPGIGVDAPVVDPRCDHLHRAGAGQHLTRLVRAVAHHQPVPVLVALAGELRDVGVDLGLQRLSQHPPSPITDDLINQRHRRVAAGDRVIAAVGLLGNYSEHGSYLSDRRWRAGLA